MMDRTFLKYFFKFSSVRYSTATLAGMFLWRKHLTLAFYLLFLFCVYFVIFTILGGPHMFKYFFVSLLFWGFAPIACVFIVFLVVFGLAGYGEAYLFPIIQWVVPWGLPVVFARVFVILLLLGILLYFITIVFRLTLICIDNGLRGTGFVLVASFFLIRAFFRYYSAGIFIQGVIVLLYEALIELVSLFFLFYWSIRRRFRKRRRVYFKYTENDVGFFSYLLGRALFFIFNLRFFRSNGSYDYYRRLFGWFCYVYELRQLRKKYKKAGNRVPFKEKRSLSDWYMDAEYYDDKEHGKKIIRDRDYLFIALDIMEDKEPEIWMKEARKLF